MRFHALPVSAVSLCVAALLSGCAQNFAMPDVQPSATPMPAGAVQGSDYGGHAPLVGAHVFVVQIGTGGYGSKVSSLLTANETTTDYYGNVFTTAQDTTANSPTNGMYYVTTSNIGTYALSGDYSCTPGYPVYLYASGGNPNTTPAVTLTSITSVPGTGAYAGGTLSTFANSGTNLLYQGEMVTFSGITGANAGFNGLTLPVVSTGLTAGQALTTSQFTVYYSLGAFTNSQTFGAGATASQLSANAPNNPAVVNLALLGNCGSATTYNGITAIPNGVGTSTYSGISATDLAKLAVGQNFNGPGVQTGGATITAINRTTGTITLNATDTGGNGVTSFNTYTATGSNFSSLPFVYMNEVSTVAAAYALAPFASVSSSSNDALHIGTSSTNLVGLQNAVTTAANLYDIGGSVVGTGGDGDTHIARVSTPNGGLGTVPQTMLNTLGNILANCVDSANTYNAVTASGGTQSPQCQTLFANATSDGTPTGTKPTDIATAAINIAHYPDGTSSNTSFVSNIFNAQTGNAPFQPSLGTAPHDFAVNVNWQTSSVSGTSGSPGLGDLAIDGSGNVWVTGNSVNKVFEISPSGTYTTYVPPTGASVSSALPGGVAIDSAGNAWVSAGSGTLKFTPGNTTGTVVGAGTTNGASNLAIDNSGYLYIANGNGNGGYNPGGTGYQITKVSTSTGTVPTPFPITDAGAGTANTPASCAALDLYITLDASGNIWSSNQNNVNGAFANVCEFSSTGTLLYSYSLTPGSTVGLPHSIAIDAGGNAWIAEKDTPYVGKIANPGASPVSQTGLTTSAAGSLSSPRGVAIDGANTVWVSNAGNGTIEQFNQSAAPITPTYLVGLGSGTNDYTNIAIDISGNVWVEEQGGQVIEFVGAGTPAMLPLSYARAHGGLGARP